MNSNNEIFKFRGVSLDLNSIEIKTERLILKSVTTEYLDEIYNNFTESLVRYMAPSSPNNKSETEEFINDSMEKQKSGSDLVVVILSKTTKEFLGCCGLHGSYNSNTPEIGIWIKETSHGNGYGKEAVTKIKQWAEDNLIYDYLIYPVDKNNKTSRKIPESLGGSIFKENVVTTDSGKKLDEVVYKIPHSHKRSSSDEY